MNSQLQTITKPRTEPVQHQQEIPRWSPALRIAFRFWMVYLGLYFLATGIFTSLIVGVNIPDLATLWPLRPTIYWTAAHVFHVSVPVCNSNQSTDCTFDWVMTFCLLMMAAAATVVWSLLDRKRENYAELHKWFRLFVRLALAGQMILYGLAKVIPLQMRYPTLIRLVQPFGTFSPMGLLWNSIGAKPAYEVFTGCALLVAGLLLIVPRTATFGALISFADLVLVVVQSMAYEVTLRLIALHCILLACFLLAPDVQRLFRFLLLRRTTSLSPEEPLFRSVRANRIALATQIILCLLLVGVFGRQRWDGWNTRGGGRPLPPLYGIWEVKQMSIDEQPRPPLLTDSARWRRAIFDYPDRMAFQRLDDSFAPYGASVNLQEKTLALTKKDDKNWTANFSFQRPAGDRLILDGRMDNHQVHMELQLTDRNSFRLVSSRFHWIDEDDEGKYDATGK